jgi:hypothetical protein
VVVRAHKRYREVRGVEVRLVERIVHGDHDHACVDRPDDGRHERFRIGRCEHDGTRVSADQVVDDANLGGCVEFV